MDLGAGDHRGVGGGGIGPLSYADIGWKVFGALAGIGSSSGSSRAGWFRRIHQPLMLHGLAAAEVARVRFDFENAPPADALLVDAGDPRAKFFVLVTSPRARWQGATAYDANGAEQDRATA